jgi:hypothetical protein
MSIHSFRRGLGASDRTGGGSTRGHFGGTNFDTDFREFPRAAGRMAGHNNSGLPDFHLQHDRDRERRDNSGAASEHERVRDSERERKQDSESGKDRSLSKHQSTGDEHNWIDKFLKERNRDRLRSKFLELSDKAKERRLQREINESLADLWTALERGLPLDFNSREHNRHGGKSQKGSHLSIGEDYAAPRARESMPNQGGGSEYGGSPSYGGAGDLGVAGDYNGAPSRSSPGYSSADGGGAQPGSDWSESSGVSSVGDAFGGVVDGIKAKASDVISSLSGSVRDLLSVAARSVGQPMWVNSPVDVAGGVYGCAATISEVLIQAGVIEKGEYNASVSGLESLLSTPEGQPTPAGTTYTPQVGKGWVRVDGPVPGAVVCGYREPRPAFNGGAHIGIVGPDGTTVFNNHSDSRVLAEDPISAFNSGEYQHDVAYYVPAESLKKQSTSSQEAANEDEIEPT